MRQVREACALKARGGDERIVSDLLRAEHKQWMEALQKEGAQYVPTREEEEEMLQEAQRDAESKLLRGTPALAPPDQNERLLEEYLEAEAMQAMEVEREMELYLNQQFQHLQDGDTPMEE